MKKTFLITTIISLLILSGYIFVNNKEEDKVTKFSSEKLNPSNQIVNSEKVENQISNKNKKDWKKYSTSYYPLFQFKYPNAWSTDKIKNSESIVCESIFEYKYHDGPGYSLIKDCSAGISVIQKFSSSDYINCVRKKGNYLEYYECPFGHIDVDLIDIFTKKVYFINENNNFGISFDVHTKKGKFSINEIEEKYKNIYSEIFDSAQPLKK